MLGGIGVQEIVIILIVGLLVFGAARLPKIARSLGLGIKEFKKTVKGLEDDDDEDERRSNVKYVPPGQNYGQQYPQYNYQQQNPNFQPGAGGQGIQNPQGQYQPGQYPPGTAPGQAPSGATPNTPNQMPNQQAPGSGPAQPDAGSQGPSSNTQA